MTDAELKRLRELCGMATPGPWFNKLEQRSENWRYIDNGHEMVAQWMRPWEAEFIAAARTALPELLDELERQKAHLREYGEHRWKCAVSIAIRKDKICPACDCGWQELIGPGGIYGSAEPGESD
jgi:hypothetical protein